MVTMPKARLKQIEQNESDDDKLKRKIIDNIPEKKQEQNSLKVEEDTKSKGWQNWCLRIQKKTLAEIDEIISGQEWIGYKKTTWILQAINKELKNERAKREKQSEE